MKIVAGSVIFAEAIEYLEDFFESLKNQTDRDFEVLLINDNIPIEQLEQHLGKQSREFREKLLVVNKCEEHLEPYMLRVELLLQGLRRGFDLLAIMDCDDKISDNRIACTRMQFDAQYTFFYHELRDFDGQAVMPPLPNEVLDFREIGECNYLGMSNGAIHLKHLTEEFILSLKEGRTRIFDWYLYSRLLLNGGKGKKISDCYTYYRIYEDNLAGRSVCSREKIEKELELKKEHYRLLSGYDAYYQELLCTYEGMSPATIIPEKADGYWWSLINSKIQK